jgi:hypothetical protein
MRAILATAALVFVLLVPSAAVAADAIPGTYTGSAKGVKATVAVSADLSATLTYSLKTACGRTKGRVLLGKAKSGRFKGERVSRGPHRTTRTTGAKLSIVGDGERLGGKLVDALKGGDSKLSGCKQQRALVAKLGKSTAFVPSRAKGHYAGASVGGHPLSFDVVEGSGSGLVIQNLLIDVEGLCTTYDDDELEITMPTHLSFAVGKVADDGSFDLVQLPDDYNEFAVSGKIADGKAKLRGSISGDFTADGVPDLGGDWNCDGGDDTYRASQK